MIKHTTEDGKKKWGRLSPDQIRTIRRLIAEGETSFVKIGEMYDVSHVTISHIRAKRTYAWVTDTENT